MVSKVSRSILNNLFTFNVNPQEGLVRFFETEYTQEYRNAQRNGIKVNSQYVKDFLAARKL